VRFLYNRPQYVDRSRPDLQTAWGVSNIGLVSLGDGIGAGPAVWCHGLVPDQHAFRGSTGGWIFPLYRYAAEGLGHFLNPGLIPGLAAAYGDEVAPLAVFDAMLALLSATSYTTRCGCDDEPWPYSCKAQLPGQS
jgi:hypothetical protein